MTAPSISRYPVPKLEALPEDIRARILEFQEKAGVVPNVFVALLGRLAEFRAFVMRCNERFVPAVRSVRPHSRGA